MRTLGLYISFTSVLTVAYSLFLRIIYGRGWLMLLGLFLGLADLTAAYLLMQERRTGLALAVFLFALTLGLSGYFLGMQYFGTVQAVTILPDLVIVIATLFGFLASMSMSTFRHETPLTDNKKNA